MAKKVVFYIDGFNFYNGLRNAAEIVDKKPGSNRWKKFYWIDIVKFCSSLLRDDEQLVYVRLSSFNRVNNKWDWSSPFRTWYERRQALVEIDVIVSLALNLTIEELTTIYQVQFPVLQQNEDDTWYDQNGNIVFTCSKGLTGVGLERSEWERITKQVNKMQRTLIEGETFDHTETKSELYNGKKITFYAPFDKCDRVEDYKIAWKHFEKVFAEEQKE